MVAAHTHREGAALVQRMFAAIDGRRWAELAEYFCTDVVYERPGYEVIQGLDALIDFYVHRRVIALGRHELERVIADGDAIVVWGDFEGQNRAGCALSARFADIYLLKDGRICRRTTFFFQPAV